MDGIVGLGECGYYMWAIALSYDGMRIRRKNFDSHEDIGTDRTERFGILLTGSL